jgi:hypothetical protein
MPEMQAMYLGWKERPAAAELSMVWMAMECWFIHCDYFYEARLTYSIL